MKRGILCMLLLAGCAAGPDGVTESATGWSTDFPIDLTRTWVGPEYWANRLQDWRIHGGRLECVEGGADFPLRTLMLLTREAQAPREEPLRLEVVTGLLDQPGPDAVGFSGFLFGAGGPQVDYRISAQVHHRPAADGGLLAVVDAAGMVQLYDNSAGVGAGSAWSVGGPLRADELLPLRDALISGEGRAATHEPLRLVLEVEPDRDGEFRLQLSAYALGTGELLSMAMADRVPAAKVDGMVGLVSHLGGVGVGGARRGHFFDQWAVRGDAVAVHEERAWGPLLAAQYTVSERVLKLTVQCAPLDDGQRDIEASMSVRPRSSPDSWRHVGKATLRADSWTLPFKVDRWDARDAYDYRVTARIPIGGGFLRTYEFRGTIAAEPRDGAELVVASLNCAKHFTGHLQWNSDSIWFPHAETAAHVAAQRPDLLYFAGDQIYEGDLDPVDARNDDKLVLDYLYKWYRFCWSFGELTRRIPTVTVPDDHDVYHGNLWGAGGRKAEADPERGLTAQDAGGYKHSARFVNVVHATQTSHLPDPVDPAPIDRGITVWFTRLLWGGVDFAILSDRMFKDSASVALSGGEVKNGWFREAGFAPEDADVPGAQLLGARQELFLDGWARSWREGYPWKAVLSQTPFVNVATIPAEAGGGEVLPSVPVEEAGVQPAGFKMAADTDSGGWPQTARDRAVVSMRRGLAVHLAGDQHLGTLVQYGVENPRDAGWVFTSPAIANTWPRRWWPPVDGADPEPGAPRYTGDFVDGFGNLMTVWAAANPVISGREPAALYDRAPGYGVVRFRPASREAVFECWPRWVDPSAPGARLYAGWPRTVAQQRNAYSSARGSLAEITVPDGGAVAEVWAQGADGAPGTLLYSLPVDGGAWAARVPDGAGSYTVVMRPWGRGDAVQYRGLRPGGPATPAVPVERAAD